MYSGLKDFVSNFVRAKQLIGLFYLGLKGRKISMVRCSYHTHGRSTTCTPLVSEWEQVIDFFFLCVCVCVCVEKNLLCSFSDGWPIFSEPELEPIIEPVIILIFIPPPPLIYLTNIAPQISGTAHALSPPSPWLMCTIFKSGLWCPGLQAQLAHHCSNSAGCFFSHNSLLIEESYNLCQNRPCVDSDSCEWNL